MGWDEDVWDFAPLKEGKTPVLKNGDSNMTTMLEMKEISSVEDLQNIKKDLSGVYSLTTDIDVSEVTTSNNVIISGTFKGMLKGNGHQIIGQKAPLFEKLNGATVENLKLTQGKIEQKSTDQVAALAKTAEAGTVIKNVYVRDMTIAGQSSVAGMVAVLKNTTVDECSVNATVNGQKSRRICSRNSGKFCCQQLLCEKNCRSKWIWNNQCPTGWICSSCEKIPVNQKFW